MGLGSLSLIYALSSSFAIFPAYVMLSKTFTLEVKTGDLYRFLFSLQTFNWKLAFLSWNSLYAHIKHFIRSNAFFFKPLIENPNMFLHLQVPWWFSFSLFVKATKEAFACFLDTHVSFQDFSFSKAPLFFFCLLGFSILRPQSRSHRFCAHVSYLFEFFDHMDILKYLHSHHFLKLKWYLLISSKIGQDW